MTTTTWADRAALVIRHNDVDAVKQLRAEFPEDWATVGTALNDLLLANTPKAQRLPMLRVLVKDLPKGALSNRPDLLLRAIESNWSEAVERLARVSNVDQRHGGKTLLMIASDAEKLPVRDKTLNPSIIGHLIGAGCNVNLTTRSEQHNALMYAITRCGTYTPSFIVHYLREYQRLPTLDLTAVNDKGQTALILAVQRISPVVNDLLDIGARPNAQDHQGWTALMYAMIGGRREMLSPLLAHHRQQQAQGLPGLNLLLRNQDGHTAGELFAQHRKSYQTTGRRDGLHEAEAFHRIGIEQERQALSGVFSTPGIPLPSEASRPRL